MIMFIFKTVLCVTSGEPGDMRISATAAQAAMQRWVEMFVIVFFYLMVTEGFVHSATLGIGVLSGYC